MSAGKLLWPANGLRPNRQGLPAFSGSRLCFLSCWSLTLSDNYYFMSEGCPASCLELLGETELPPIKLWAVRLWRRVKSSRVFCGKTSRLLPMPPSLLGSLIPLTSLQLEHRPQTEVPSWAGSVSWRGDKRHGFGLPSDHLQADDLSLLGFLPRGSAEGLFLPIMTMTTHLDSRFPPGRRERGGSVCCLHRFTSSFLQMPTGAFLEEDFIWEESEGPWERCWVAEGSRQVLPLLCVPAGGPKMAGASLAQAEAGGSSDPDSQARQRRWHVAPTCDVSHLTLCAPGGGPGKCRCFLAAQRVDASGMKPASHHHNG